MRRLIAAMVAPMLLVALSVPAPAAALYAGQVVAASASWRSGPFTFMGYANAYREVNITIWRSVRSGQGLLQCVEYRDMTYELHPPSGVEEIQQTVSRPAPGCIPAEPVFSPLMDSARLAATQVPTYSYTRGGPATYGSVSISFDATATGPWVASHHFAFLDPAIGELYLGWNRTAAATATVDGTALGPPSDARLHWGTWLQR